MTNDYKNMGMSSCVCVCVCAKQMEKKLKREHSEKLREKI